MRTHSVSRVLLGCVLSMLLTASFAFAQPGGKKPAPPPSLPEGLNHVPVDAMGFLGHLHASK